MKLPARNRDLRRYVLKNDLTRAALYLAWLTVWFLGAHTYNQRHQTYPPERRLEGWRMLVWMLIGAAIGFFLFRIWRFFKRLPVRGTIIRAGLSHTYTHSEDPGAATALEYDFRLRTSLVLRKPNGKKRRMKFEQKIGSYQYYHEGAEILRLRGLPYPVNLDTAAPHGYVCVACGRIHPTWQEKCEVCELSLVDPRDLKST